MPRLTIYVNNNLEFYTTDLDAWNLDGGEQDEMFDLLESVRCEIRNVIEYNNPTVESLQKKIEDLEKEINIVRAELDRWENGDNCADGFCDECRSYH